MRRRLMVGGITYPSAARFTLARRSGGHVTLDKIQRTDADETPSHQCTPCHCYVGVLLKRADHAVGHDTVLRAHVTIRVLIKKVLGWQVRR